MAELIRCVHRNKPPQYFNKETAMKRSWQQSTGWTPQPIDGEVAPVQVLPKKNVAPVYEPVKKSAKTAKAGSV